MSIYVSPQGVANAIEKIYIGIQGVAQELDSVYVGVNDVARVVFKRFSFAKYNGEIEGLEKSRFRHGAASAGKYALFAGGCTANYTATASVEGYDDTLTRLTVDDLQNARDCVCGITLGNYALFGGGSHYWYVHDFFNSYWTYGTYASVDAYDKNLVHTKPDNMASSTRFHRAGTVGKYVLFAGGEKSNATVCAYDAELTRTSVTGLSTGREKLGAASVGDHVLFAGGYSICATVDAYDTDLVRTSLPDLSVKRQNLSGAETEDYALFAGGMNGNSMYATVDIYDKSLTRRDTSAELFNASCHLSGLSIKNHAIFAGGQTTSAYTGTVNIFDRNLTMTKAEDLTGPRTSPVDTTNHAAVAGKYVVYAGGKYTDLSAGADVYAI